MKNKFVEIEGDLIKLAQQGKFDVIAHGCNCRQTMGAGIAPQMAKAFGADIEDKYFFESTPLEQYGLLGNIHSWQPSRNSISYKVSDLWVVNCYTQYNYGPNHPDGTKIPLDYDALKLCMKKINHEFQFMHIGLPLIGAGLAGGSWLTIKQIIQQELTSMDVTIVHYKP